MPDKKAIKKYPKINIGPHRQLEELFGSASLGAAYIIAAFPAVFHATLKQLSQEPGDDAVYATATALAQRLRAKPNPLAWSGEDALRCASAKVQPVLETQGWSAGLVIELLAMGMLREESRAIFATGLAGSEEDTAFVGFLVAPEVMTFYENYFPSSNNALIRMLNTVPGWVEKTRRECSRIEGLAQTLTEALSLLSLDSAVAASELLWPAVRQHVRLVGPPENWPHIQQKLVQCSAMERFFLEIAFSPSGKIKEREVLKNTIVVPREFEQSYLEWLPKSHAGIVFSYTTFLPALKATLVEEVAGKLSARQLEVIFEAMRIFGAASGMRFGRTLIPALGALFDLRGEPRENRDLLLAGLADLPLFARGALEFLGAHVEQNPKQQGDWIRLLAKEG